MWTVTLLDVLKWFKQWLGIFKVNRVIPVQFDLKDLVWHISWGKKVRFRLIESCGCGRPGRRLDVQIRCVSTDSWMRSCTWFCVTEEETSCRPPTATTCRSSHEHAVCQICHHVCSQAAVSGHCVSLCVLRTPLSSWKSLRFSLDWNVEWCKDRKLN